VVRVGDGEEGWKKVRGEEKGYRKRGRKWERWENYGQGQDRASSIAGRGGGEGRGRERRM
jgi:hypothetical protein